MLRKIKGIEISGITCCVPKSKVFNKDIIKHANLSKSKDVAKKRIIKAIGIESRHVANNDNYTSDLVIKSANHILKKLNWKRKEIDVLVFVSQTGDYSIPATSGILQNKLKLEKSTLVFDVNLGCSGYTHGLIVISSIMRSLNLKKGLLAVGDVLSKLVNRNDNISNMLFGDGVSVTAITNSKNVSKNFYCNYYSNGEGYDDIIVPSYSLSGRNKLTQDQLKSKKDIKDNIRSNINIHLNGPNVFNFGINDVHPLLKKITKKFMNIKYCFLHQANQMIQDSIEKQLNNKKIVFPSSLKNFGNTSGASIPITICYKYNNKKLKGYSLLCGFGVGLSISTVVVNLEKTKIFKIIKL
jgi:3-oxoacyl-[acyl-carrier-protein] synthase-3